MLFKFHVGTKVYFGRNCVKDNIMEFSGYGTRAVIVTGKNSGKSSGALDDVSAIFEQLNIKYMIYDKIENNPALENIQEGAIAAASFHPHFIVGIGGGSPLDAAKAVAVLAANDIEPAELFKNAFRNKPLPVIAIPTTAGTGSEVTPYSILTRRDMQTKMSFGNEDTFPKAAFIDASYTESLPADITVNTAVDAFSHALEGYLSKRSTPVSDILAVQAIDIFGQCVSNLQRGEFDFGIREKLLYMSMLGGMVISQTGTTIVHGMGYSLTYFKNIPHGRANGLLMSEYLKFIYDNAAKKVDNVLKLLRLGSIGEFGTLMGGLLSEKVQLTEEEIRLYALLAMKQKSASYNVVPVTQEDLMRLYRQSLKGKS